jgi:CTP synthase
MMQKEGLDRVVLKRLALPERGEIELETWKEFLYKHKFPKSEVNIGLVGKYVELKDSYKSIAESFIHAGSARETKVNIHWIHSEKINQENVEATLGHLDGILVAPGFGERGMEGKILTVEFARTRNIPFLGICLGMQMAVIEFARNVLGLKEASSTEMQPNTPHPVIDLMESQKKVVNKGGTMRLGSFDCTLTPGSKIHEAYHRNNISERHRHRYEFNNQYLDQLQAAGLKATGINPQNNLVEVVEIENHPWFVGVQFHPEYKSTVLNPHPLFVSFVEAANAHARRK